MSRSTTKLANMSNLGVGLSLSRGGLSYFAKVLAISPATLVAYWPLNDMSGTQAVDLSGNNYHGQYQNTPTLGDETGPHGEPVPFFDVANSEAVDLSGAFQTNRLKDVDSDLGITLGEEGTIGGWCKVNDNAMWTDGSNYLACTLRYNSADDIHIKGIDASTDRISYRRDTSGTDSDSNKGSMDGTTGWYFVALTWSESANEVISYVRLLGGALETVATLAAGAWGGVDYRGSWIGSYDPIGSTWHGHLFGFGLWSAPLSTAQVNEWSAI